MANYYYGINKGAQPYTASVAGATTGKDVEIVVNGTNVTTRQEVKIALENLLDTLIQSNWPPV